MPNTLSHLSTYLEILDVPKKVIHNIISRNDIVLYSILRDKLSTTELLELQIILKDICMKNMSPLDIDFSKFISLDTNQLKLVSQLLKLKSKSELELSTIIQLEPKDLAFNILNTL